MSEDQLKAKLSVLKREYLKLRTKSDEQVATIKKLEEQVADLSGSLEVERKRSSSAAISMSAAAPRSDSTMSVTVLEGQNASLEEQLRRLRSETDMLRIALDRERQKPAVADIGCGCDLTSKPHSQLTSELRAVKEQKSALEEQVRTLEVNLKEARSQVGMLKTVRESKRAKEQGYGVTATTSSPQATETETSPQPHTVSVRQPSLGRDLAAAACQAFEDPGSLLHIDGSLADVSLTASSSSSSTKLKLKAHRFVLLARCARFRDPSFATSTEHDDFAGLDAESLQGILEYLYTDRLVSSGSGSGSGNDSDVDMQVLKKMLHASAELGLPRLRELVEQRLASMVTPKNAAEMFALADPHRAPQLRVFCQEYMLKNFSEMAKSGALTRLDASEAAALLAAHSDAPLHTAVELGRQDVVRRLLQRGVDVNARVESESSSSSVPVSPLEIALDRGFEAIAANLVDAKCDLNAPDSTTGNTMLYTFAQRGGDNAPSAVKFLLENGAMVNATNKEGSTALHAAVLLSDEIGTEVVSVLLGAKAVADVRDADGHTPLSKALWAGKFGAAQLLVDAGADVNALVGSHVTKTKVWGHTLLHAACSDDRADIVSFLLKCGAEMLSQNAAKEMPIHLAVQGRLECLKALLSADADPEQIKETVLSRDASSSTPLHIAAAGGFVKEAEVLLEHLSGDDDGVNAVNDNGQTAVQVALWAGNHQMAGVLVKRGADISSLLHYSAHDGNVSAARFLIAQGADVNQANRSGQSPLHTAAWMGHTEVVMLLLNAGADPLQRDDGLLTTLHAAAMHPDVAILLVQLGVPVDACDQDGNTPTHTAAEVNNVETLRLLLQAGAHANVQNVRGETPLHKACTAAGAPVVRLLLGAAADSCAKAADGSTPLHAAVRSANDAVIAPLMQAGADHMATDSNGLTPFDAPDGHDTLSEAQLKTRRVILENITKEPRWQDDKSVSKCPLCQVSFTVKVRRHHCRHCGRVICGRCSPSHRPLPRFEIDKPVRVCSECESVLPQVHTDALVAHRAEQNSATGSGSGDSRMKRVGSVFRRGKSKMVKEKDREKAKEEM